MLSTLVTALFFILFYFIFFFLNHQTDKRSSCVSTGVARKPPITMSKTMMLHIKFTLLPQVMVAAGPAGG
jgi:hypothetical protein